MQQICNDYAGMKMKVKVDYFTGFFVYTLALYTQDLFNSVNGSIPFELPVLLRLTKDERLKK